MIAADTSSMIAFLQGDAGDDVEVIQSALDHQQLDMHLLAPHQRPLGWPTLQPVVALVFQLHNRQRELVAGLNRVGLARRILREELLAHVVGGAHAIDGKERR